MSKPKENRVKQCVLKCQNDNKLFGFPDQNEAYNLWLKILGVSSKPLRRSEMHICLNHFSSRQLSDNGRTLTPTSIPDKNIPGKVNPTERETLVIQPPATVTNYSLTNILPHYVKQCTMITSEYSKCYLKCKTYKSLHRFPSDLTSFNVWTGKLGLPDNVKLNRTASLCDNHFSPVMRTLKTISRTAVPDLYLPSQCTFIDEFAPPKEPTNQISHNERITSVACSQTIMTEKQITVEVLTNPITSIVNVADPPAKNEGTPPASQPTSDVICPENYENALKECVLKCPGDKILYRFPNVESRRQLWLSQIGLTHCFCNTRICSRHFSEKMFSKHRLTNSAFPDINLPELTHPRIRVASLPMQGDVDLKMPELPQYICVLTVLTHNAKINTQFNETKYVKYSVNKRNPKRERGVQVDGIVGKVNVAISADEDFDNEELEIVENINFEQQPDLVSNRHESQFFPSKSKDMFECLKCGEITLDRESNLRHLDLHKELSSLCFQCGGMFVSRLKLKRHEMKVHGAELKRVVRCPKERCNKAFYSRKNLNQHLDDHAIPAKHFCVNCGRLFFSSLKLQCHLLVCRPKNVRSRK